MKKAWVGCAILKLYRFEIVKLEVFVISQLTMPTNHHLQMSLI